MFHKTIRLPWSGYRLAAEQGDANAQNKMGKIYENGTGIPQDYVRAHMWWNIAASSDESKNASKNRDSIANWVTSSQREKAQGLARKCIRKKYKGLESF